MNGLAWVVLTCLMVGCTAPPIDSGLHGTVTVGPNCPVARDPPEPDCADRPLSVQMGAYRGDQFVARFTSDDDGQYHVSLAPGTYTIRDAARSYPACHAGPLTISPGAFTRLDIACDSGIR